MSATPKSSFPIAEIALGSEFNECSIAAAELNKSAMNLFESGVKDHRRLHEITPEGMVQSEQSLVWLTDEVTLSTGREVYLALSRVQTDNAIQIHTTRLIAVTRGDITVPLASFTRRPDSPFCDYVQLGSQIHDEMVVTPLDEESDRFKTVQLLRSLLGSVKTQYAGPQSHVLETIYKQADEQVTTHAVARQILSQCTNDTARHYSKDSTGLGALLLHGIHEGVVSFRDYDTYGDSVRESIWGMPGGNSVHYPKQDRHIVSARTRRWFDKYYREYSQLIANASLYDGFNCDLPGLNSGIGKLLLFKIIASKIGYRPGASTNDRNILELLSACQTESLFESELGEYMSEHDELLRAVGAKVGSFVIETEVQTWHGNSSAATDVRIAVEHDGAASKVSYYVRPDAMEEKDFVLAGVFNFNRLSRLSESPEVVAELLKVVKSNS